jgi:hypothetical protein
MGVNAASRQGWLESRPTPESGCEHGRRFGGFNPADPGQGGRSLCSGREENGRADLEIMMAGRRVNDWREAPSSTAVLGENPGRREGRAALIRMPVEVVSTLARLGGMWWQWGLREKLLEFLANRQAASSPAPTGIIHASDSPHRQTSTILSITLRDESSCSPSYLTQHLSCTLENTHQYISIHTHETCVIRLFFSYIFEAPGAKTPPNLPVSI